MGHGVFKGLRHCWSRYEKQRTRSVDEIMMAQNRCLYSDSIKKRSKMVLQGNRARLLDKSTQ